MTELESMDVITRRRQLRTQNSTIFTRRQHAVCVRSAFKHYGTKKSPTVILDGLNMTVPKGCIYGLLGASGCGKTTLLSCIVGRRRLKAGDIWVLGGRPGSKGSGVPGPRIGYMPQELALYGEFSIQETLVYYGWVAGKQKKDVEEKIEFLLKFLLLPPADRFVKTLSGGQQRRVSFAAALVHDPELLILDEPTVGVDPVLRQSIWDHLVNITQDGNKTVIITTHYIEETRQAGMIGLMRGGRFLAEESPEQLMAHHMCDTLEDVFLKLSKMQNQKKRRRSSFMQEVMGPLPPEPTHTSSSLLPPRRSGDHIFRITLCYQFQTSLFVSLSIIRVIYLGKTCLTSLSLFADLCVVCGATKSLFVPSTIRGRLLGMARIHMTSPRPQTKPPPRAIPGGSQSFRVYEMFVEPSWVDHKVTKILVGKDQRNQIKIRLTSLHLNFLTGPVCLQNLPEVDTMSEISGEYGDNTSISIKDMKFNVEMEVISNMPPEDDVPTNVVDPMQLTLSRMKALIWKNFLWMWRNVGVMLFIFLLPVLQIILFCLSIGRDPLGLHLAVFNQELNDSSVPCDYFDDLESAKHAVESGLAWGTMHFSQNYSDSLVRRLENVRGADELTIDNSDIHIWMDMSNQQIGQLLNRDLILSYVNFTRDILSSCNYTPQVAEVPIRFNNPVYGDRIPNFTDFAAPGVILTIIFFLSVALTSGAMLIERNEGMLERSLVSGITGTEILFSHVVTQFVVMCGQTAMVLIFSFVVFNITCRGDITTVSALTVLTGLCGMCFGFVVSCLCDTERTATYLALGSFLPIVMLCGIIWPVEGMHYSLKFISFILPLTKSTESLRTILARGWSISQPTVYFGFVATLIWMAVFLTISILVLKFRKG
uniref:ABC transporter domain-containing protein n=1 Tax=Timema tahoe TaxID=61484 RepID=A0A7R9IDQ2_9NEOP|nr:unnamed protein product [Timema tahoe]